MFTRCPKCRHQPLPADQALPAACPACGVILAKVSPSRRLSAARNRSLRPSTLDDAGGWRGLLWAAPERIDRFGWAWRALLLAGFALWGLQLIALDRRDGEMAASFIHGPLLIFHEAGHVLFRLGGEWLSVLGGTLGQLLMPALLMVALLWKNRDAFGAAIALWLLGVSLLDVAPYVHDALDPQLMLLSGSTGEAGGHDWIYLLSSMGLLHSAHGCATIVHTLGAALVLLALAWGGAWLWRMRQNSPMPAA
ncbi:MAG: hypothetical protein ABIR94_07260 [Rubrivivax sp.]